MEFIDLKTQYRKNKIQIDKRINSVLSHGKFIQGPEVLELEEKLEEFTGTKFCISCANGTDAIQIALMAIGIKPGDEVIVPAFTFIGTAEPVSLLGATPVFVDVDPHTFNIDTSKIEASITKSTRAIIAVSLFGLCADFDSINSIAKQYDLFVIEDSAQSFGAKYKGKKSCNLTDIACTSFFPSKPLGCYGDGGALFTNNKELAETARTIARHGQTARYQHDVIGVNSRLDTIEAAILLAKLERFENELTLRKIAADRYTNSLSRHKKLSLQAIPKHSSSVFAQYSILVNNRRQIIDSLNNRNIPTAIHYPTPLNKQKAFGSTNKALEVSNYISEHILSIPFHPHIEETEQNEVIEVLLNEAE